MRGLSDRERAIRSALEAGPATLLSPCPRCDGADPDDFDGADCIVCGYAGVVPALCDECNRPAVEEVAAGRYLCEAMLRPCVACDGEGCRACVETGSERRRRAELEAVPSVMAEEITARIPAEPMAEVVRRPARTAVELDGHLSQRAGAGR